MTETTPVTITPRKVTTIGDEPIFPLEAGMTVERLASWMQVSGVERSGVAWNGHQFEVVNVRVVAESGGWSVRFWDSVVPELDRPHEIVVQLYFPIDPRTDETDWDGATSAKPNETNTGWLPSHCDADYHNDHELILESAIYGVFQAEVDKLDLDAATKLRTLVRNPRDSSAGSRELAARLKLDNLLTVRRDLVNQVIGEARKKSLGWYQQNPRESHLHEEIASGLTAIIAAKGSSQTYSDVSGETGRILTRLKTKHAYETRWDQKARLKKEAEAREMESEGG